MYYVSFMSMGKRRRNRQSAMWVPITALATTLGHPFCRRLNRLLREHGFDDFVEAQCAGIGYFEGIGSERGIAWRAADSFALRDFLSSGLEEAPPADVHRAVLALAVVRPTSLQASDLAEAAHGTLSRALPFHLTL